MSAPISAEVSTGGLTLADLVDDYFANYAGRDGTRTHRLAWWVARFGSRPAIDITDEDVVRALEDLARETPQVFIGKGRDGRRLFKDRPRKRQPATINRYHVALMALYSWAGKRRRLPRGFENPCRTIEKQREPRGRLRFLSDDERERLFATCKRSPWKRLYLLALLAITTGARQGELLATRWQDVDIEPQAFAGWAPTIYVRESKNDQPRMLPLVPAAVDELRELKANRPKREQQAEALVFCSPRNAKKPYAMMPAWYAARRAAHLENFRFHDLRHTCASYLAQQGAGLLEIADVLGQKTLAMAKRYSHLTTHTKARLVNRVLGDIR